MPNVPFQPGSDAGQSNSSASSLAINNATPSLTSSQLPKLGHTSRHKISPMQLESMQGLVIDLAREYDIPIPRLEFFKGRGFGFYDPEFHHVLAGQELTIQQLPSMIHHEMNHAGQAKCIAVAKIVYPEKFAEIQIHPIMTAWVMERELFNDPLYVSIGDMFGCSRLRVERAKKITDESLDEHDALREGEIYRNSFEELTPEICRLEYEAQEFATQAQQHREQVESISSQSHSRNFLVRGYLKWIAISQEKIAKKFQLQAEDAAIQLDKKLEKLRAVFERPVREREI